MYFYSVSSFLLGFAQKSNYSRFLNGSFWRGLNRGIYSIDRAPFLYQNERRKKERVIGVKVLTH
jgi:hypothetical protein